MTNTKIKNARISHLRPSAGSRHHGRIFHPFGSDTSKTILFTQAAHRSTPAPMGYAQPLRGRHPATGESRNQKQNQEHHEAQFRGECGCSRQGSKTQHCSNQGNHQKSNHPGQHDHSLFLRGDFRGISSIHAFQNVAKHGSPDRGGRITRAVTHPKTTEPLRLGPRLLRSLFNFLLNLDF